MKTIQGNVMIDKRTGCDWITLHFADGGAAVTLADILDRLEIDVKHGDRLKISIEQLPRKKSVTVGVSKKKT
jgi:hypothetical protein